MQKLILLAGLSLATIAHADDKPSTPATAPIVAKAKLATKTQWLSGLKEPQGMAFYGQEILIADYDAGRVLRYSREGKLLGTLAQGLKSPSQIVVFSKNQVFVSERKANRVIQIDKAGNITPVGQAIEEPLGLVAAGREIFVVSHTTSKIYRFEGKKWTPIFTPTESDRYGYRCLAYDKGTLLLSDEDNGEILMLSQSGRLASWAKGIADPSGITIGADGATYVCDEGDGGRLWRVNNIGEKTIVAEGLGRPRGVLFLDKKTILVSDRNGKVWKLVLP